MASKKTVTSKDTKAKAKKAAAAKAAKSKTVKAAPKGPKQTVKTSARHPRARVADVHGGKAALAKAIASSLARADEDAGQVEARLKTASNAQLLRLQRAVTTLKDKYGSREKLIAAIGTAHNKTKDRDYLARLDRFSLPQLLDLASASQRRA